jgi:uncharacterized protein (TIGR03437 family)
VKKALLLILGGVTAHGYIRLTDSTSGTPLFRKDNTAIQYYVNDKVAPGIKNRSGGLMISADSSPVTALQQAMASWNASGANVKFLPLKTTPFGQDPADSNNVIVFADTDAQRAAVNGAVAITANVYTLDDYHLVDSDILFNPEILCSTSGTNNSQDIQSVVAHELGHALGSSHTNLLGATMFQAGVAVSAGDPTGYFRRVLSSEDIAFASAVYPGASASTGTISGTVTLSGAPAKSALLTFIDVNSGVTMGGLSGPDGKYSLAVPTGSYVVYAEPFNKIVQPGNLYLLSTTPVDTAFKASFFGGNTAPGTVTVSKGATASADIQVPAGNTAINVAYLVFAAAGKTGGLSSISSFGGATTLTGGQSVDIVLSAGSNDATLADAGTDLRVLGKGIRVRSGSVRVDPTYASDGFPILRATLDIDPITTPSLASIFLVRTNDSVALSGALVLLPQNPVFSNASVTSSASFSNSAVSPGEIASIFGTNLGPVTGWNNSDFGFDSSTGALPTTLGGVKVTFDGILAPLFYSRADIINVQVPFEVAGKAQTDVVVSYNGLDSTTVTLPVAKASPGIFTYNGSGKGLGIVVNQDGSLNTAANPAAKGSVVVIYLTGRGVVPYAIQTGKPAPLPPIDSGGFTCQIAGADAPVAFGGWTYSAVGLAQANVTIPASTPSGEQSLVINIGGATSQSGVTLFVK